MTARTFATGASSSTTGLTVAKINSMLAAMGSILTPTATNFAMTDSTVTRTSLVFLTMTRTLVQTGATFATTRLTSPNTQAASPVGAMTLA
jgi:hypothetical protein